LRVIVDLSEGDKINKKISARREKLEKFLLEKDIEFYDIPSLEGYGYCRSLINDVSNEQFDEIFAFITEKLKASPKCIHLPYQTLGVNGEGNLEAIDEPHTLEIDRFVQSKYNKQLEFPSIIVLDQNKYIRTKWSADLISVKCVCCHERAEYINSGLSLCKIHFVESLKKQKKFKKESEAAKKAYEKTEKQLEKINKSLEQISGNVSAKPREHFKKVYE
jgi:hypothetical protein